MSPRAMLASCALLALAACHEAPRNTLGGDADNGRLLLRQFGCGSCHRIPGVVAAEGRVGPPLEGIARRVYHAGSIPNSPEAMARFIREPHAYAPGTTMPDLDVGASHARDMVAYLEGLR